MFGRGDHDGIDVGVREQLLVILVSLGGVSAHGLHTVLRTGEVPLVRVADRDHLYHVLAGGIEAFHEIVAPAAGADPPNVRLVVRSEGGEDAGRAHDGQTGGRFNEGTAGIIWI